MLREFKKVINWLYVSVEVAALSVATQQEMGNGLVCVS